MFDINKLQYLLSKWQSILRLREWGIKLELVTNKWLKTGNVKN